VVVGGGMVNVWSSIESFRMRSSGWLRVSSCEGTI
jgi:hypothetical protein